MSEPKTLLPKLGQAKRDESELAAPLLGYPKKLGQAEAKETPQRTLIGDLHPRNWPRRLEDTFTGMEDNYNDWRLGDWHPNSEELLKIARLHDRVGNVIQGASLVGAKFFKPLGLGFAIPIITSQVVKKRYNDEMQKQKKLRTGKSN